jgi:hypothetical protein
VTIGLAALAASAAACAEEPAEEITNEGYTVALGTICADTDARLNALAQPSDEVAVAAFAASVSDVLRDESELARQLVAPPELDADHRAFIRNTDEQAERWERLGATPAADPAFGDITVEIGELTLGRNDLVAEMGVAACERSATRG